MYTIYHYGDPDGSMQRRQIAGMEDAIAHGCNSVCIGIAWDVVQPSLNSNPDWAYIDRFVDVAQRNNVKVAFRIRTIRKDRTGYWPEEQSMKDTRGNVLNLEGGTHVRFGYTPAIDKIQDFVRSATQRYKYLNDRGDLLFMAVTFNPGWENEYWGTNFPDQYATSYDFNEFTIGDFQRWAVAKYNGSLDAVNKAWGTNYQTISTIQPTYPDASNGSLYLGKRGSDWYSFRHSQLKSFNDRFAKTVKSVDPTIRVITEQGSVIDTPNRGTLGFKSLSEFADGVKVNDSPGFLYQFSMDLLRSNVKPGGWVLNEVDGLSSYRDQSNLETIADQIETSFKYGAKIVTFANYFLDFNQEGQLRTLLDGMKAKRLLEQPVPTITPVGTMTYKLSTVVQGNLYSSGVFGQWATIRGGNQGPVRILLDEDIIGNGSTVPQNSPPTVVNRVPNQTAVVSKSFSFKIPDNTFTDSDGQITGVAVSGLPAGLNYDPATRTISGTPSLIGSNEITVTATDNSNATVTDYFVLAVKRTTLPLQLLEPILDCSTGRFEFRSTEGDGSAVEYSIDNVYSWNTQTVYTLSEALRSGSTLSVRARQSGTEVTFSYKTTCPVVASNKPPVVNDALADQTVIAGQAFSIVLPENTFTDPDGTIASVNLSGLPTGVTYVPSTRTLAGTIGSAGVWPITVTATDDKGASVSTSFKLTAGAASNTKPLRLLNPLLDCTTGRFEFRSADGDGTPVEYAADQLYSYNTRSVYTLTDLYRFATVPITVRARQSGVEQVLSYTVTCSVENKEPVVSVPITNQTAIVNKSVSILIPVGTFADSDGTIASVAVNGLPPGLSYDAGTRLITGTVSTTGVWTVTVTATDDRGATIATTFTIKIGRDVKPLRFLEPLLDCNTGLFEFRTADGDGSPIEYSIDRVIAWSPQSSFTLSVDLRTNYQLDIKARQGDEVIFGVFRTSCPPPNQLPTVKTPLADQTLTQFRNVSLPVPVTTFNDADGTIDHVSIAGIPPGLIYADNTHTLSGAPTATGVWTLTAIATDNRGGTVSTTFVVTVIPQVKPLRLLPPVIDCVTGKLEFQTADGDGTTISYSIDQVLNWTNQAVYTLAEGPRYGTALVLRVRQSGTEQMLTYTTPCVRPNKPPVVAIPVVDQVLIVNTPASFTVPAGTFTDPDGTIASVTLTGLPVGLSYDPVKRVVQGIPTLIGTSPAVAKATDNAGASVSDTFLITVRAAPRFAVTTTLLDVQGKVLKDLVDGDLLDSKKMPVLVNLSCQPKVTTGSVLMELTGKAKRTVYTNAAPYLLYPTGQGFKPDIGSYQLKVSVFSGANGTGALLGTATVRFDITLTNEGG
ncbi:putative Ig domain-containing protein [Fibrella forsythiae]|uniref:Ig domain-containing protein n=1 Tax=Fibrella forsythiae TaxID=2817061 RepID=A0ABS3JJL4_9BACT|nr:putative Ig domain-containing protein [Fibrella forsythiae]MBO0950180.1 putative Ig domain-containing protein [Fibrella forsythiae]